MTTPLESAIVTSAHEVDLTTLTKFYRKMFSNRGRSLPRIWKWLNRSSFYENQTPLVMVYKKSVIAHAGMIPFYISVERKRYAASWFIDFSLLPEFQRQGLGSVLAKKWMDFPDLYVTFCNDKSMGLFKKFGWIESFNTYLNMYPLNAHPLIPFDQFQQERNFKKIYEKYARRNGSFKLELVKQQFLEPFMISSEKLNKISGAIRDSDYLSWRLLGSPDRNQYRICRWNDTNMVIKLCDDRHGRYIDLLCLPHSLPNSLICQLIANLALWGIERAYFYIRHFTMNGGLATYLKKYLRPVVRHSRFAFYTKNKELLRTLKTTHWHWELIDSDWENF